MPLHPFYQADKKSMKFLNLSAQSRYLAQNFMEGKDFTHHPEIVDIIQKLNQDGVQDKTFSDVIDNQGHQYVDLVQEGGGVLGFALVGYSYILEQMGLRFLNLAGTSAGAINTLLLASLGDFDECKSDKLIHEFARKDLLDFVSHDNTVKNLLQSIIRKEGRVKSFFHVLWNGFRLKTAMNTALGINNGENFHDWLSEILDRQGIKTTADLFKKRGKLPDTIQIRENVGRDIEGLDTSVVMIAADLTTQTKVKFPEMNVLYWNEPEQVNPADYVRASMSIPFLFEPYEVNNLPKGHRAEQSWQEMASYKGPIPEKVQFVDGGTMSNFPIDAFHIKGIPRLPSFGVKLGINRENPQYADNLRGYLRNLVNAMRQVHDFEFLAKHQEYEQLIQTVDIGDHIWFDFDISNDDKKDLFIRGAKAADEFLRGFNWQEYKQMRYEKLLSPLS